MYRKAISMIISELTAFSNKYGANASLVLAGGGNTSAKEGNVMYVKGSGTQLATITADKFVRMDRTKLAAIFDKAYPESDKEREALALEDLMNSRLPGEENKRPSVETTLHSLFPQTFVLHLHPALVNGLTCGKKGEMIARELFGDGFIWVELCRPGYVLAKLCCDKMRAYKEKYGRDADILLLQNHGIFFASDTVSGLGEKLAEVMDRLSAVTLGKEPDFGNERSVGKSETEIINRIKSLRGDNGFVAFDGCGEALRLSESRESAAVLMKPFTPDHIVYCKAFPLYANSLKELDAEFEAYTGRYGFMPKVFIIKGTGFFAAAENEKNALAVKEIWRDAVKIAVYSQYFGGALHMTDELTDFIINWEVESYRAKQQ